MKLRQLTRRVAAAVAGVVVTSGLIAVTSSAPAQAARTAQVRVELGNYWAKNVYGTKNTYQTRVSYVNANGQWDIPLGTINTYLQEKLPGKSWRTVATGDWSHYWYRKMTSNAQYRVYFSGGSFNYAAEGLVTYPAAYSPVRTIKVHHKIKDSTYRKGRKAYFKGSVSPKYKGKVKYQTKRGGKWKTIRKIKLSKGHRWNVRLSGKNRQKFRILVPKTRKLLETRSSTVTLYVYHYKNKQWATKATTELPPLARS